MNRQLQNIAAQMEFVPCRWGFCGGWGIDLFLGHATRPHQDIDIAVLQREQHVIWTHLNAGGWGLRVVKGGAAFPWLANEMITIPDHEVWCQNPSFDPPKFEMLLNESDATRFVFRRDRAITMRLERAFLRSDCGLPILAPEIILLYKSKDAGSTTNAFDFQNTLSRLDGVARQWLRDALSKSHAEHPWIRVLGD